ncbi:MAG: hypothetical protein ACYDA6_02385, partial [Solirubrobacteraceae bacterium]
MPSFSDREVEFDGNGRSEHLEGGHDSIADTLELAAEAMLREHPDAFVCALAADGLITQLPKSVGLWGQAAIEGRALIDHVVAG